MINRFITDRRNLATTYPKKKNYLCARSLLNRLHAYTDTCKRLRRIIDGRRRYHYRMICPGPPTIKIIIIIIIIGPSPCPSPSLPFRCRDGGTRLPTPPPPPMAALGIRREPLMAPTPRAETAAPVAMVTTLGRRPRRGRRYTRGSCSSPVPVTRHRPPRQQSDDRSATAAAILLFLNRICVKYS